MYELIYCSLASSDLSPDNIEDILKTARDFNAKNNITGCLLYHNKEFIQILEGEKKIVKDLYHKIEMDKRHFNKLLLAEGDKEERSFNDWSMAFHELNEADIQDLSHKLFIENFIVFSESTKAATFPMILFWKLAKTLIK